MPITRLESAQAIVEELAGTLLSCSRALGSVAPDAVPSLNAWAYGDVIMVLGSDMRQDSHTDDDLAPGLAALTHARQQLP